jgi:uncharacterized membrane protein YphA (DoxX/SURF4 family)
MSIAADVAGAQGARAANAGVRPSALFAFLRIYLGVVFLIAVSAKLRAQPSFTPGLVGFLQHLALENAHPFYRPFVTDVVLPHAGFFAKLVIVGELLVGLALVTGTATRLAAVGAMVLVLNYMFAKGAWFWTPSSNDAAFFFIALVVGLSRAGRTFGVDRLLARRWPNVPLW